jgi:site-specific DNA recombinase
MTRTAIYCRVSTPGQKDTTSLPEQERLSRAHAASLGWEVSEPHVYREVEGGADLYRPCMERLLNAVQAHEIDGLIIDVLDRLSRDEGDVGAVYYICDRHGVQIELANEDIDETQHGRNLRPLSGMMARMERDDIRRRTQRGRKARAAAGKLFPANVPLYGYLWATAERIAYVIDPETAPIVVRIYVMVADGIPIREVARILTAEGIPTPAQVLAARGMLPKVRDPESGELVERDVALSEWQPGTIGHILHHPAYVGQHSVNRYAVSAVKTRSPETGITRKEIKTRERAMDDPERIALPPSVCPALITPDLASRVQAQLSANKDAAAGNNPDPLATIWRGLAYCGHCGARMSTTKASWGKDAEGQPQRRYRCSSVTDPGRPVCLGGKFTINATTLDPAGWADVRAWLREPKNVERLMAEWEQKQQTSASTITSRLEAVNAQIAHLCGRMSDLAQDISETQRGESRDVLKEKLDELAAQLSRENGKRDELQREASEATDRTRDERDIRAWVCEVASHAENFTPLEQRVALRALGAEVTVWRGDYQHPDGWPQRYQIELTFTGFTGQPVILPASYRDADINMLLPLPSGNA